MKRTSHRLSTHRGAPGAIWRVSNPEQNRGVAPACTLGNREQEPEADQPWAVWLPGGATAASVAWLHARRD